MKTKHKEKVQIARHMFTPAMKKAGYTLFNNPAWNDRKDQIAKRVERKEATRKAMAEVDKIF